MTDRERLVELIKHSDKMFGDKYAGKVMSHIDEIYEFFADHILADGWVRPPFTIGQTVYAVDRGSELYWKGTISSFYLSWEEWYFGVVFEDGDFATCRKGDVFLTREEAEKALEGGGE